MVIQLPSEQILLLFVTGPIFISSREFSSIRLNFLHETPTPKPSRAPAEFPHRFAFFGRLPFSEGASISIFPFSSFCVRPSSSGRWRFQSVAISITSIVILFVFVSICPSTSVANCEKMAHVTFAILHRFRRKILHHFCPIIIQRRRHFLLRPGSSIFQLEIHPEK